eukprot:COSAG06_NODE_46736_length_344_cov_1.253061_1_plen_114_part_11
MWSYVGPMWPLPRHPKWSMAAAMPADWFPKTGTPTAAQIASFLMRLHDLKTIVWANYPTAGVTCMADWIVPTGSNLTALHFKVYCNTFCASSTMIHQTRFYVMILSVLQTVSPP